MREVLAAALAGSKPSGVDGPEQGWVAIAYQNAFYHLARGSAFEDALVETVGLGGDTDTLVWSETVRDRHAGIDCAIDAERYCPAPRGSTF
jgi:hypothetical protein